MVTMSDDGIPILDLAVETPEFVSRNIERLIREHGGVRVMNGADDHGVWDVVTLDKSGIEVAIDQLNMIVDPFWADLSEPDDPSDYTSYPPEEYFRKMYGERYWENAELRARIKNLPIPADAQLA